MNISIRAAAGPPALLARSVSAALTAVDPDLAFSYRPLQEFVDASVSQERILARLAGLFGGLALLLTGLGLYGVTSYAVSRRQFEIGIRMALGAGRGHVLALMLVRSLAITAAGVTLGIAASVATTRYLATLLFGVSALDPVTLTGVALLLIAVAAGAALIPAVGRRGSIRLSRCGPTDERCFCRRRSGLNLLFGSCDSNPRCNRTETTSSSCTAFQARIGNMRYR